MADKKHPIIAHGELYVEPIIKKGSGGDKKIPHEYQFAKQKMIQDLDRINRDFIENTEIFLEEKIICIRMEPKFEAKSYVPTSLVVSKDDMEIVGGRKYTFFDENGDEQNGKLYFMRTNDVGIQQLSFTLKKGIKDKVEKWCDQIGSIHSLDLLSPDEKIMGFNETWESGAVEIVLHPIKEEKEKMISVFYKTIGISKENTALKSYDDGLTFISTKCTREEIDKIKRFNPLRALHPLGSIEIEPMRGNLGFKAPSITSPKKKSKITIGVFDGGTDENIPLLKGYTKSYDCVESKPHPDYVSHGTGVCGAILHGNLAGKYENDILPVPNVSVDSFRVLPLKNTNDFEAALGLYEAIDAIEAIVKSRPDIKLYNLSFGPKGAILDDSISRFTYVLDKLTYDVPEGEINPLFTIAVGNDGNLGYPLNRIQSPSDMVNGLGVGAYSYTIDGNKKRASYSCIGAGREGAKVKPDFLEFGGSQDRPFVLVGAQHNTLSLSAGTSFASPLAVGKIGKMMAKCEKVVPHMGRTLLIHNADIDKDICQIEQGYGFCAENIDDFLMCDDNKVTILYTGSLIPTQIVKLPIFSPAINNVNGKVKITWTIATVVDPCLNDPDAYTNNGIDDVFIPHELVYNFTKKGSKPVKLNLTKPDDAIRAKDLLSKGYKKSDLPVSQPAKKNWNETDLRMKDFKWDSIIRKRKSMQGNSLLNPYLTLHALGRNGFDSSEIKYYAAITIEASKYNGSLYDAILQNYQNLAPIEIRNINRIMVEID